MSGLRCLKFWEYEGGGEEERGRGEFKVLVGGVEVWKEGGWCWGGEERWWEVEDWRV